MTDSDIAPQNGFVEYRTGETPQGLMVFRASRLEALALPLAQMMAALPPDNILAPQTVIAAHAGMRQWLLGELARLAGTRGIVANVDVLLPSSWIQAEASRLLGAQAIQLPKFQPDHLRWRIHRILEAADTAGLSDARLARYLAVREHEAAAAMALRHFQLSDRLARLYSQYMMYRPDWLEAWAAGQTRFATAKFQDAAWQATEAQLLAPLWQRLQSEAGDHRGRVIEQLTRALLADPAPPRFPLHVFGLSHLAPSELAALKAAAKRRLVIFYVPDPCREYWGGVGARSVADLHRVLVEESASTEAAGQDDAWRTGMHPMLARWGRMGRDFLLLLSEGNDEILVDTRHGADETDPIVETRLQRVQESIRRDDPALLGSAHDPIEDASLRIHACHTRVRELEVVRDAILDAMDRAKDTDHPLLPSQIAVFAPDIGKYAGLVPGVFGAEADRDVWPPYSISDNSTRVGHPLYTAFEAWLNVPGSRITASQVLELLSFPAVARAYGITPAQLPAIHEWLRAARASWGIDGAHRARLGVPGGNERTSLRWSLDRLMASYLYGDAKALGAETVFALPASDLAPAGELDGGDADALGGLYALLDDIERFDALSDQTLDARTWAQRLDALIDGSLAVDKREESDTSALTHLRQIVHATANEMRQAEEDRPLHFSVIRELLTTALANAPSDGRFLRGGITFAGMVPQRSVPFRFIAVLGLNEGEFPRQTRDSGLDLTARLKRVGDRDLRNDDRWLFLETLMSAREQLHLSYLGLSPDKGEVKNAASPLAELDALLIEAWQKANPPPAEADEATQDTATDAATGPAGEYPWQVRHALQPFSPRYYTGKDPRLFSFNERFVGLATRAEAADIPAFVPDAMLTAEPVTTPLPAGTYPLRHLIAYYKDPAKYIFKHGLDASLDALSDSALAEHEPMEAKFEAIDVIARRVLFNDVLPHGAVLNDPPRWLAAGGYLPLGSAGDLAWQRMRARLTAALEQLQVIPAKGMQRCALEVDLPLADNTRLRGTLNDLWATPDGDDWVLVHFKDGQAVGDSLSGYQDFKFRYHVPLFIEWAAARLTIPLEAELQVVWPHATSSRNYVDPLGAFHAWGRRFDRADTDTKAAMLADVRHRLAQLQTWATSGTSMPLAYFPETAHASLVSTAFETTWLGKGEDPGERAKSPYSTLLGRGHDFSPETAGREQLVKRAKDLHILLALEASP